MLIVSSELQSSIYIVHDVVIVNEGFVVIRGSARNDKVNELVFWELVKKESSSI